MNTRFPLLALLGAVAVGCSPASWGSEVKYAPEFRGYAFTKTLADESPTLIVNPVTGAKLCCKEHVEAFVDAIAKNHADQVHDENAAWAIAPPATIVLFPFAATGVLTGVLAGEAALPSETIAFAASSPGPDKLFVQGRRAFEERRWTDSEQLLERSLLTAITHGDAPPNVQRANFYLGVLYERERRTDDATRAYRRFIEHARVRDTRMYDEAEKHLSALDSSALRPCSSQAPVTVDWAAIAK